MKLLILDVETSGLHPERHAMIELGAIIVDENLNEIGQFLVYIRPWIGAEITESAMKVNRIDLSNDRLDWREPVVAVWKFHDWVNQCCGSEYPILTGWNPSFDKAFLKWYYDHYGTVRWPFSHRVLDVQSISAFCNDFRFVSLDSTMKNQTHRALDDCVLVLKRLRELRTIFLRRKKD